MTKNRPLRTQVDPKPKSPEEEFAGGPDIPLPPWKNPSDPQGTDPGAPIGD